MSRHSSHHHAAANCTVYRHLLRVSFLWTEWFTPPLLPVWFRPCHAALPSPPVVICRLCIPVFAALRQSLFNGGGWAGFWNWISPRYLSRRAGRWDDSTFVLGFFRGAPLFFLIAIVIQLIMSFIISQAGQHNQNPCKNFQMEHKCPLILLTFLFFYLPYFLYSAPLCIYIQLSDHRADQSRSENRRVCCWSSQLCWWGYINESLGTLVRLIKGDMKEL